MQNITIRKGKRHDSSHFLKLLVGLANFERLAPPDADARRRIVKDVFSNKIVHLFLAFAGKEPVGYALYFYTYSSFLAKKTFYLEDIFVLESFRGSGVGRNLFMRCVEEAGRNKCGRFEFAVLTWNKNAIEFYEKLGARRLVDWYYYRMTEDTIGKLRNQVQNRKRKTLRV